MRFTFQDKSYGLEFERNQVMCKIVRKGKEVTVPSKYPYTTARVYVFPEGLPKSLIGHATVGCFPKDKYSHELGRKYALRALSDVLKKQNWGKEFLGALWQSYVNRAKLQGKPREVAEVLPAEPELQQPED
jgi:hypothetical protein